MRSIVYEVSDMLHVTRRSPNARLTLAHHLRRWPNINPALGEHLVLDTDRMVLFSALASSVIHWLGVIIGVGWVPAAFLWAHAAAGWLASKGRSQVQSKFNELNIYTYENIGQQLVYNLAFISWLDEYTSVQHTVWPHLISAYGKIQQLYRFSNYPNWILIAHLLVARHAN